MSMTVKGLPARTPDGGFLPTATKFVSSDGEYREYYIQYNAWKFSDDNKSQKHFRYCIICGDPRFSSEEWKGILRFQCGRPPTICKKESCWDELGFVPKFVPRKYYIVETDVDKSLARDPIHRQYYENVDKITTLIRFDKVYKKEEDMLPFSIFKDLEKMPVETRIAKLDVVYFSYAEAYKVRVGEFMSDTSDPYLKALATYREECYKILEKLRNEK